MYVAGVLEEERLAQKQSLKGVRLRTSVANAVKSEVCETEL